MAIPPQSALQIYKFACLSDQVFNLNPMAFIYFLKIKNLKLKTLMILGAKASKTSSEIQEGAVPQR